MKNKPTAPQCTCGNAGRCGYCPRIAATAAREAKPYTDPAWQGRHPLNPGTTRGGSRAA